jgi:hypothetical protein
MNQANYTHKPRKQKTTKWKRCFWNDACLYMYMYTCPSLAKRLDRFYSFLIFNTIYHSSVRDKHEHSSSKIRGPLHNPPQSDFLKNSSENSITFPYFMETIPLNKTVQAVSSGK